MKMKKEEGEVSDGRTKIHNVRFYNLTPRQIQCLAFNKVWNKLALSRGDGSVEIWDMEHAPYLEKTIPQTPGNSVEGIAWAGERLFTVGLSGELVEWNLQTLEPLRRQFVTGNAIWCIDVNALGTELAIGTEEGFINIIDIADEQMQYKQLFDKQEGRVLCCKYDAKGEFLVTGSQGAIRIWDVRTGHALHKMTVPRIDNKKEVIVWSLQVLSDFSIISGDSRGYITVWDGRTASQVESHQVLKADVLVVTVNEEENLLMCSGIEPIIRIYAKTKIKKEDMVYYRWVKFLQRNVHDHDVKALVCAGERIISGGLDGYVGVSSMSKTTPAIAKYGPFLQSPCAVVAPAKKLLLLRYTNYLEIWRLSNASQTAEHCTDVQQDAKKKSHEENVPKLLTFEAPPEKLLEFKSKHEEPIVCATLSLNGQWLCYSTQTSIRLFRFIPAVAGKNATQLQRVKDLPEQLNVASHIQFSADSKRLFTVNSNTRQIFVFSLLSNGELDFSECIELGKHIKDRIQLFAVSQCDSYIAVAGIDRTIGVWRVVKGKHFKHHMNLPRYPAATTAIAIHPQQARIVAAFSDGKLYEYDLEEMCFTCSERQHFIANSDTHYIKNIVLDARNPNVFILHNDSHLFVLEKYLAGVNNADVSSETEVESVVSKKKTKRTLSISSTSSEHKVCSLRLKMEKPYEHLISLAWLSSNELVAVGVNTIAMIEHLPGAFKQKKFGAA